MLDPTTVIMLDPYLQFFSVIMDPSEAFAMILRHRESMTNPSIQPANRFNNGGPPPYPQQQHHQHSTTGGHYGGMTYSYGSGGVNGSGSSFIPPYPQEMTTTYNQQQQWQPSPPPLPPPQPAPGNRCAPFLPGYQLQNINPPYHNAAAGLFVGSSDHYPLYPVAPIPSYTTQHYPEYTGHNVASTTTGGHVFHSNPVTYTIPSSSSSHNKGHGQKKKTSHIKTKAESSVPIVAIPVVTVIGNNGGEEEVVVGDKEIEGKTAKQVWYCEPCDKEFTQLSNYEAHCITHEKCRHPGCEFSGTKKVVIAHYHGSHGLFSGSGYKMIEVEGAKFRVLLGTSPDEVEKWRAERKNKFPTTDNISKKQMERDELQDAGGVVPRQRSKKRTHQDMNETQGTSAEGIEDVPNRTLPTGGPRKKPCVFFARGTCRDADKCKFSHDFEPKVCTYYMKNGRCTRGNNCTYIHDKAARAKLREEGGGSADTGTSEEVTTKPISDLSIDTGGIVIDGESDSAMIVETLSDNAVSVPSKQKRQQPVRCVSSSGSSSSIRKEGSGQRRDERTDEEARAACAKRKGSLYLPKPLAGGARGTLLKRLLHQEIEEDENIILQCLRLVVETNFLNPV